MIAQIATKCSMKYNNRDYTFSDEALQQLAKSAQGKPIKLGLNGPIMGEVTKGWVENDSVFVEFEAELLNQEYLVPGFQLSSSKDNLFTKVRMMDLSLTNKPHDFSLKKISELNDVVDQSSSQE